MDAAIAGLVGSLGGVIVGVLAQAAQAVRNHQWQLSDQRETRQEQRRTKLWQERRTAYAEFMRAILEANHAVQWAWLSNCALPPAPSPQRGSGSESARVAADAMQNVTRAIQAVQQKGEEVLLLTDDVNIVNAVSDYNGALLDFNPSEAHSANPNRSAIGLQLDSRLANQYRQFMIAARSELEMSII